MLLRPLRGGEVEPLSTLVPGDCTAMLFPGHLVNAGCCSQLHCSSPGPRPSGTKRAGSFGETAHGSSIIFPKKLPFKCH